ncbi:MAG TPA: malate dehydrogenase, partial [Acidobacteriota bacterium]|nr:malate dehydrogenase [Acidobacteriota bacterium]
MTKELTVDELLEKAKKPAKLALAYHPFYEGKMQVMPKCAIRDSQDFAIWYTPGVAAVCKAIEENPDLS